MPISNAWNPKQYRQFAAERAQPFHDLISLIQRVSLSRAVDLGCGPGELTTVAARTLNIGTMIGIDSSPAMLERAAFHAADGLSFTTGDISKWTSNGDHDLVLAAASLQWVPNHSAVLRRWTAALAPGGQLAVHVPANANAATHLVATELAEREPYRSMFGSAGPPVDPVLANVLEPEEYATLLYELGFESQHVRLVVYPHQLPSSRHAVEWVKGTTLTRFEERLPSDAYRQFVKDYEKELLAVIGNKEPLFFPFRRILMWAQRRS